MREIAHRGISMAGWIVVVGLTACGGGGDEERPGLTLVSKQDVLRELGVLDASTDFVASSIMYTAKRGPAYPGMPLALKRTLTAKDMQPCNVSGSSEDSNGSRTRQFQLIDTAPREVQYFRTQSDDCSESYASGSSRYDVFETGLTEDGQNADGSASYTEVGQSGPRYSMTFERFDGGVMTLRAEYSSRSLRETRRSGTYYVTFSITDSQYSNLEDGVTTDGEIIQGTAQYPFRTGKNESTGEFSVDGEYRYRTSLCSGGSVNVLTLLPLTAVFDGNGNLMTGGRLRLDIGSSSALVTFNGDGSATYQLDGGSVGTLTRGDMDQQLLHPCG
jgi:hypothetical protein